MKIENLENPEKPKNPLKNLPEDPEDPEKVINSEIKETIEKLKKFENKAGIINFEKTISAMKEMEEILKTPIGKLTENHIRILREAGYVVTQVITGISKKPLKKDESGMKTINLDETIEKINKKNREEIKKILNKPLGELTENDERILENFLGYIIV